MFTGIISAQGRIEGLRDLGEGRVLEISVGPDPEGSYADLVLGESIAVDGVCLTVEAQGLRGGAAGFRCTAGFETLARTTLARYTHGRSVHLERALRLSDRLGGHLVTGHVDAVGTVHGRRAAGVAVELAVEIPAPWRPLLVEKGSLAVDGVSLTVAELWEKGCTLMLIPHTCAHTHLGALRRGDSVNLETDLIGKYVARMLGTATPGDRSERLSELLAKSPKT